MNQIFSRKNTNADYTLAHNRFVEEQEHNMDALENTDLHMIETSFASKFVNKSSAMYFGLFTIGIIVISLISA
ncbi:hypothetical protein [Methylovorus glucosotrophus]|uniref:Uncharacterized protein n=1 Tax=Methylovorus glucosotrophus (strain SIP3-4) TaxID=582744 RepID=C6X7V9_METGS|nr:hypothetical protein [Methylovorus glucosotrophus]ACT51286.1 hypothetical protein Msip34_2044 [Methylovorus glucosotrophus SIP3-4]